MNTNTVEKSPETILSVQHVNKHFKMKRTIFDSLLKHPQQKLYAINDVSLDVKRGEILGVVGESGCGKTTLARLIIRLHQADGGSITLDGKELTSMRKKDLREACRDVQMIFQDPYASLNPRMTVREILKEVLTVHQMCPPERMDERLLELMDMVGLRHEYLDRLPGQFSGGQRQRIGIARALAMEPKIILADEPVSALDVSIQAQIINLLKELRDKLGLTIIFISHDLSVVHHISDRVVVLYLGRVMEEGTRDQLFRNPCHPYTKMLLEAVPQPDPESRPKEQPASSDFPSPLDIPSGCRFRTRCPYCDPVRCEAEEPELTEVAPGHFCACHFGKEIAYV